MTDPRTASAGVAVYSAADGPLVFLSPHAVALSEPAKADLMRTAARALTREANRRDTGAEPWQKRHA